MSRIAKVPIKMPDGVQAGVSPDMVVSIKGPKGELAIDTRGNVRVELKDGALHVQRHSDQPQDRAYHGLYHRLITNAVQGVTEGYRQELELVGVGYRAEMRGQDLILSVGRSHEEKFTPPSAVSIESPKQTSVVVSGPDKQQVFQAAAMIRQICPPEPYKGKGIRYLGEAVRRKVGKAGAK